MKTILMNRSHVRRRGTSTLPCYEFATFNPGSHLPLDVQNPRGLDVELPQLFPGLGAEQADRTRFKMNAHWNHKRRTLPQLSNQFHRCVQGLKLNSLAAVTALAMLLGIFLAGCATSHSDPPPVFTDFNLYPPSTNVLDQADMISVTFRYSTNFDTVQKIGLDGMVNLEGVGQVKAAGKTVLQLQAELTALYKSQVKDDPITVRIANPGAAVYVTGAVNHPGKILMDRPMTVVEAIAEAGGFDQYRAKLSKVSILRVDGNTQRTYWLDVNRVLNGEDPNPFFLKPFDVIHVPTKTFNF